MISGTFWATLTAELKVLVTDLWAANIATYRANMATAQDQAARELTQNRIRLTTVAPDELAEQRKRMLGEQDKVAREMRIAPDFLARIDTAVAATE